MLWLCFPKTFSFQKTKNYFQIRRICHFQLKRWIQKMESLPAVASDFKEVAIVNRLRVINVHLRAVLELGGLQHGAKLHKLAEQVFI